MRREEVGPVNFEIELRLSKASFGIITERGENDNACLSIYRTAFLVHLLDNVKMQIDHMAKHEVVGEDMDDNMVEIFMDFERSVQQHLVQRGYTFGQPERLTKRNRILELITKPFSRWLTN